MPSLIAETASPRNVEAVGALTELRRRMRLPQRHRLLHGYPLAAAMPRVAGRARSDERRLSFDPGRGLLVGVLPHPTCETVDEARDTRSPRSADDSRSGPCEIFSKPMNSVCKGLRHAVPWHEHLRHGRLSTSPEAAPATRSRPGCRHPGWVPGNRAISGSRRLS
jgi:hypothetical protein